MVHATSGSEVIAVAMIFVSEAARSDVPVLASHNNYSDTINNYMPANYSDLLYLVSPNFSRIWEFIVQVYKFMHAGVPMEHAEMQQGISI